jgi:predicted nucleic acid-binding protein
LIVVETSVWIDVFRGAVNDHTGWLSQHRGDPELGLVDLVLCEVLQGVRDDQVYRAIRTELLQFGVESSGEATLAVAAAENYRALRKKGITVRSTIDCLIATFCIQHGHRLFHHDRDFDAFERHLGLRVIHP